MLCFHIIQFISVGVRNSYYFLQYNIPAAVGGPYSTEKRWYFGPKSSQMETANQQTKHWTSNYKIDG